MNLPLTFPHQFISCTSSITAQVKFEGEGVDDYGGPYREVFQLVCDELQLPDPYSLQEKALESGQKENNSEEDGEKSLRGCVRNFLPLLFPTPNFSSTDECAERYRYMFRPGDLSDLHLELYGFLGQLVGIAVRSKITLDLALPSYIWKCVAREALSENDIHSFDAPAARFITRLASLHDRLQVLKSKSKTVLSLNAQFQGDEDADRSARTAAVSSGKEISSPICGGRSNKEVGKKSVTASLGSEKSAARRSQTSRDGSLRSAGSPTASRVPSLTAPDSCSKTDTTIDSPVREGRSREGETRGSGGKKGTDITVESVTMEIQDILQDIDWTYVRSDQRTCELIQGGLNRPVRLEDLGLYLQLYVQARLREGHAAIRAFRSGLSSIVPESSFTLSSWEDVQRIVCGCRTVDIDRLRDNTEYDEDVTAQDQHVLYFWEILHEFSEEEKIRFLKFVWARPTLPPKGVEFLQKMKIQSAIGDEAQGKPDQYLPKAHTCFFSINLPRYSSKQVRTLLKLCMIAVPIC